MQEITPPLLLKLTVSSSPAYFRFPAVVVARLSLLMFVGAHLPGAPALEEVLAQIVLLTSPPRAASQPALLALVAGLVVGLAPGTVPGPVAVLALSTKPMLASLVLL